MRTRCRRGTGSSARSHARPLRPSRPPEQILSWHTIPARRPKVDPTDLAARRLADEAGVADAADTLELALRLTRLARLHATALDELAGGVGVTTAEGVVLSALAAAPGRVLSPTALHGMVVQSPAGITKTLRRLEVAGLVERRRDPRDGRALLVALTRDGVALAHLVTRAVTVRHAELLEKVPEPSRRSLRPALRALVGALEADLGFRSSGPA